MIRLLTIRKRIAVAMMITGLSTAAFAADHAHWSYSGEAGPQHWGTLDAAFGACATGKNQSPVNLTRMVRAQLPPLSASYQGGGKEVVNNGHTIQVNYAPGSDVTIDGHRYELKQFHFHSPSENTIEGRSFPMEAHFVHADKDGNLAVVAVMFERGEPNRELQKIWSQMPEKAGDKQALNHAVDVRGLLPRRGDYYRFNGSLTTPPCSEGVVWVVMKASEQASREQIEQFRHVMHHANNRPTQPLNARVIMQ